MYWLIRCFAVNFRICYIAEYLHFCKVNVILLTPRIKLY